MSPTDVDGEPFVPGSNLIRIAEILGRETRPEARILSAMLAEIADAHAPAPITVECKASCMNEEWPCTEWQRAEHYAVDWLIAAYEART